MLTPGKRKRRRNVEHWQKIQETIKIIFWAEDYNIKFWSVRSRKTFWQKKNLTKGKMLLVYIMLNAITVYDYVVLKRSMKHILQILPHYYTFLPGEMSLAIPICKV